MSHRRSQKYPRRDGQDERFLARDHGLADVCPEALQQLTKLLHMQPFINVAKPDQAWLNKQEADIMNIHGDLRMPDNLLKRWALKLNQRHHFHSFPQMAELCPAHKELDGRMIRNLTYLVSIECTRRSDRWRQYRDRHPEVFCPETEEWLQRLDGIMTLWIGQKAFKKFFGYKNVVTDAVPPVESGCEACLLSIVGGRLEMLGDLRANMLVRQRRARDTGREDDPRLLRIVEAWIDQLGPRHRAKVRQVSDDLVERIYTLFQTWQKRKEEQREAEGRPAKSQKRRHRHGKDKKPKDNSSARLSRVVLPDLSGQVHPALAKEDDEMGRLSEHGIETQSWLRGRMGDITPEEVRSEVHPAFSDFQAPSAVPEGLMSRNWKRKSVTGVSKASKMSKRSKRSRTSRLEEDRATWVSASVYSIDDPLSPHNAATPAKKTKFPFEADSEESVYPADSEDSDGNYIPVRRDWNKEPRPLTAENLASVDASVDTSADTLVVSMDRLEPPSMDTLVASPRASRVASASSYYSDHPGFPTNHGVTTTQPGYQNPLFEMVLKMREEDKESQVTAWFSERSGM